MKLKTYLISGCAVVAGLVSCQVSSDALERSEFYASRQNYYKAYWILVEAHDAFPDDEELGRMFWIRRLDYLLDRGEHLVFEEREQEAIEEYQKALALDPENGIAKAGIARARGKLATGALYHAETLRHEGDLDGALKLYNKALSYVPELEEAVKGVEFTNERYQRRTEKSGEHYTLGSRARGEQRFRQSFYHSGVAKTLDESNQRAGRLYSVAGKRLAADLFVRAKEMEAQGFYAAALQDYRQVQISVPDTPGLEERIAEMDREVKVRDLCREAEMLTRKKEFDAADEKLAEAFEQTRLERANVSGLMLDTKNHRYQEAYTAAKDMEFEYRFEAALEAFLEIDKAHPNRGFLDVKTRISGLKSYIEEANKSWEAGKVAEKAGKVKEALDHYEEAVLVYPGFQGLDKRIKELRARLDT